MNIARYQTGMVMDFSLEELRQIAPYLRYSNYIWNKLYTEHLTERWRYTSALQFLEALDAAVRNVLGYKTTAAAQEKLKVWKGKGKFDHIPSWITKNNESFAFGEEVVKLFTNFEQPDPTYQILQDRLKDIEFPSPDVFYFLIRGLQQIPRMDNKIVISNYDWSARFPKVFTKIDLTEWTAQVNEILTAFAQDRHTTLDVAARILTGGK